MVESNLHRKRRMLDTLMQEETKEVIVEESEHGTEKMELTVEPSVDERALSQWFSSTTQGQLPRVIACSDDEESDSD